MQLASHGERAVARHAPRIALGAASANKAFRFIHIPSLGRITPSTHAPVQRVLSKSRTILSRFIGLLTAPGIGSSAQSARHGISSRIPSIHERLSLPVRMQLARPMQGHYIPKVPRVPTYSITQLGLGTARNFSTTRQAFQRLAENVPVTGRAFCEADLDIKTPSPRNFKSSRKENNMMPQKKEISKPKMQKLSVPEYTVPAEELAREVDFAEYFASPVIKNVTYLIIPLAPTPTDRVPLPSDTFGRPSMLRIPEINSNKAEEEGHSARVSSLFSRLDDARVWERGANCSTYGTCTTLEGTCTILKVEFQGWNKSEVRSVIGELGTGWCVLEEEKKSLYPGDPEWEDDSFSDTSSVASGVVEYEAPLFSPDDPVHSFVLPTIDFSVMPSLSESDFDTNMNSFSDVELEVLSNWSAEFSEINPPGMVQVGNDFRGSNTLLEPRENMVY